MNKIIDAKALKGSTRREVVIGAALVGGALTVGGCSPADILSVGTNNDFGAFGPFLKIAPDGVVTVISKHIEFGQGNHAGLAAIVSEELDADWSKVRVEQAAANTKVYMNTGMGAQGTGGSSAIANSWEQLRKVGASARAMFVQAAAAKWSVPPAEISIRDGVVSHAGSGRSAPFGELVADAAKIAPPETPVLKDPKAFTLIGSDRVRRKDAVLKSTGQARFTQDVRLPDMLTAVVAHPPRFGAIPQNFDSAKAKAVPGVIDVFSVKSGVAVVADSTWAALQGRDALSITWDERKSEKRGSDAIAQTFRDVADGKGGEIEWQGFDSKGAVGDLSGPDVLTAAYDFPYLAHATMEPMNCVAQVKGRKVKLTFGSQFPTLDQLNAAKIVGTLPGSVEIETLYAGGSFGRRCNFQSDYVAECVRIAKKTNGRPVKLVWTREDDQRAGYFRPLTHHAVAVRLDKDGYPAAWRHRIVTQSIMKGSPMGGGKGPEGPAVEGAMGSPYLKATPAVDAQVALPEVGVPVLWWRSVGATHTAYAMEHTIDQLARKAGKDPADYRRALYQKAGSGRHLAVLGLLVERSGWKTSAPEGWVRGLAVHESFGSVVGQVAEVKLEDGQPPKVGRVTTVIDCGTAISPDQIAAQMEGGTCYGLSAALFGQITLIDGVVQESNFDTYRVLRMNEAPTVETHILPSTAAPSGVGEPGTPVIGPAVANAILAATGKATFSQPFVKAV